MILDASALVALVVGEPEFETIRETMSTAGDLAVGAPTLFEAAMVLRSRLGAAGRTLLDASTAQFEVDVVPFDAQHWPVALDAFTRFGKGRHPAGLNFGDCLAYAIARVAGEPLLCVGGDFAQTDLELA